MKTILEYLADHHALFTPLLMGVGMCLEEREIRGVGLGAAVVLFLATAISAYEVRPGVPANVGKGRIIISREVGILGLAIFAFATGNSSGRSFFQSLKHAAQSITAIMGILIVAAACIFLIGRYVFAVDLGIIAGTFAGGITDTPAPTATGEVSGQESLTTIGYAVSHLSGVLGTIVTAQLALRKAPRDTDTSGPVTCHNVRVEHDNRPTVEQVEAELGGPIEVSRIRRGEEGSIWIPDSNEVLEKDNLVAVIGTIGSVNDALKHLGHKSSHSLRSDRRMLDFRHVAVSKHSHAGKTVTELDKEFEERWGAKISRVRRGDADMLAMPNFMVELGGRVRVVGPTLKLKEISKWLGDSSKGLDDIDPVTLGLGLVLGYFVDEIGFPIPDGGYFALGYAAGILITSLIMGRVGRIGPFITTLPSTPNAVLAELRLSMFLARAGTNTGTQVLEVFPGGYWWGILILGLITTTVVAVLLYIIMRGVFKMGGTKLFGLLEGVQTQPAVLTFANGRTGTDPRVTLGHAFVYPVAMIVRILLTYILGTS